LLLSYGQKTEPRFENKRLRILVLAPWLKTRPNWLRLPTCTAENSARACARRRHALQCLRERCRQDSSRLAVIILQQPTQPLTTGDDPDLFAPFRSRL